MHKCFRLNGKSYDLEWIREGHRNYPLIGRAPPYSALHILADHAAKAAAIENASLPEPLDTRRSRMFNEENANVKQIVCEDPTLPPTSPATFGISRKELKRSLDLSILHQQSKKKHYQHLKPPPPPNAKIQHLYQTLNAKRQRKSLTKKSSKGRPLKQNPGRMQISYPLMVDEKQFDGAELQRHLTAQLMPPPMSPMKTAYGKKDSPANLIKMNRQQMEPQAHYIPNHPVRLKGDMSDRSAPLPSKSRSARSKNAKASSFQQKYANGAGARNNMDHIPDPQIIFSTTSSSKLEQAIMEPSMPIDINTTEIDLSPSMASPLQLLSTAASCTPKLKVTTPISQSSASLSPHHQQQTHPAITVKAVHNRSIKLIPATATSSKPQMIIKSVDGQMKPTQSIITTTPSKFKIQKIQLVMNKNQDGTSTATTSLSPSATIVSGKAGQLVLSGKSITNSFQMTTTKQPFTIISGPKQQSNSGGGPKVIVQTIDRTFAVEKSGDSTGIDRIPENQRITENTPIDFLPSTSSTVVGQSTNYPKVILKNTSTASPPKHIKLKLGPGLVAQKIIKGPIPSNLKIQRPINAKSFTVLNSSQFVQIQPTPVTPPVAQSSTKVDWEQELDDVNRTTTGKSAGLNSDAGATKKLRLDTEETIEAENMPENENMIVETIETDVVESTSSLVVYGKNNSNYTILSLFV